MTLSESTSPYPPSSAAYGQPAVPDLPYANWGEIRGVSVGGHANRLTDLGEIEQAGRLLLQKFPQGIAEYASGAPMGVAFFKVVPRVISVLDYRKGFGHKDFVSNDLGPTPA